MATFSSRTWRAQFEDMTLLYVADVYSKWPLPFRPINEDHSALIVQSILSIAGLFSPTKVLDRNTIVFVGNKVADCSLSPRSVTLKSISQLIGQLLRKPYFTPTTSWVWHKDRTNSLNSLKVPNFRFGP